MTRNKDERAGQLPDATQDGKNGMKQFTTSGGRSPYAADNCQLAPQHEKLLVDSAIDPAVARERKYRTETVKANLKAIGFGASQLAVPTLVIELFDVRGKPAGHQHRPDQPRFRDGKAIKYETPYGMRMVIDLHPSLSRMRSNPERDPVKPDPPDLPSMIADPTLPLVITEGVRKADAAVSTGLCCVALLGVWNWRGTNESGGKTALADWEFIALKGRDVCIAFDSDVMMKVAVNKSMVRLKSFLKSRGAAVRIIYLPGGRNGEKVGLDDWIAARVRDGLGPQQIRDRLLGMGIEEVRRPDESDPNGVEAGPYRETCSGLIWVKSTQHGEVEVPLTNFTARIITNIKRDDGVEATPGFEIEAHLGKWPSRFVITTAQFGGMRWAIENLGSDAVVFAGTGVADHARTAIQLLSKGAPTRTTYTHTGWREINGVWVYLHGDGAIGSGGAVEGIAVELPPELALFRLAAPSGDAKRAIQASLALLDLGPDRITVPALGSIFRAILGGADYSVFLYGRTGVFKTELAALVQQHFGLGFDARHLPTSFTSTANTNEALAFACKDAVLVVDELHPPANGSEREQLHRDASRLLRAQGNAAGRGRMRVDGSLRPPKPPRGILLATGEELPRGQSVHARLLTLEVRPGNIAADRLAACQCDAREGLYAQATAAFLCWLAPRLNAERAEFERLRREVRTKVQHDHARTADVRAQLTATFSILTAFLLDVGALADADAERFQRRIGVALGEVADAQLEYAGSAEPTGSFLRLLGSAIGVGRAHIADREGNPPAACERACGWRPVQIGIGENQRADWQPKGDRVGWLNADGDDLYLDRDASYRAAQAMSAEGAGIEVSAATLARRLRDKHLLASTDPARQTLTVRRMLDGKQRDVLHLSANTLGLTSLKPDIPDISTTGKAAPNGPMSG